MLFEMFIMVKVMQVITLFEIKVKKKILLMQSKFLDNVCSVTLKINKIWICWKRSHLCTITFKQWLFVTGKCVHLWNTNTLISQHFLP